MVHLLLQLFGLALADDFAVEVVQLPEGPVGGEGVVAGVGGGEVELEGDGDDAVSGPAHA